MSVFFFFIHLYILYSLVEMTIASIIFFLVDLKPLDLESTIPLQNGDV